jgi:hypothetical protein
VSKAGKNRTEKTSRNFKFDLNLASTGGGQERAAGGGAFSFGTYQMESIRPGNSDPIPVPASQHHVGTILIRFVGILFAAIAVMAVLWSR